MRRFTTIDSSRVLNGFLISVASYMHRAGYAVDALPIAVPYWMRAMLPSLV